MTGVDPTTERLIALALDEDLGHGDPTAAATVPAEAIAAAAFVTRQAGVVSGLDVVAAVVNAVDPGLRFTAAAGAGDRVDAGAVLARIAGSARSILAAERTALNLLTHLCGVASETARFVMAVQGTGCVVRDTRKTLPGLRAAQKAAVADGGGINHRFNLGDALLVKDNHVAAAGGVGAATRQALAGAAGRSVQIEVDSGAQLEEALAAGAGCVLLDNFAVAAMGPAVERCRQASHTVFVEVSGNVTLDTVAQIAATGVDAVAVGALTHSVRALDIGLDWEEN